MARRGVTFKRLHERDDRTGFRDRFDRLFGLWFGLRFVLRRCLDDLWNAYLFGRGDGSGQEDQAKSKNQ